MFKPKDQVHSGYYSGDGIKAAVQNLMDCGGLQVVTYLKVVGQTSN